MHGKHCCSSPSSPSSLRGEGVLSSLSRTNANSKSTTASRRGCCPTGSVLLAPGGARSLDDDIGLDRPVREGIEDLNCGNFVVDEEETPVDINEDGDATSEEEKEAGGVPRTK